MIVCLMLCGVLTGSPADVTVSRVVDGDTIVTSENDRVELHGIDAPEMDQPHGAEAKAALEKLCLGKRVRLLPMTEPILAQYEARAMIDNGDVGVTLVMQGMARVTPTLRPSLRNAYLRWREHARSLRLGIWQAERRRAVSGLPVRSSFPIYLPIRSSVNPPGRT